MTKRRAKGEGSLYFNNTSQRWVAQISLPNGKRKSKSHKSQKVVRDWLIAERNKVQQGLFVANTQIKLGEYLERYIDDVARHTLRPRTLESNMGYIKNHIKPQLGNIKLIALRPDQIQRFYTSLLNKGLSKRTVQYIHAILHKALKQALKWGLITKNPSDLVEVPKPDKKRFKIWNPKEVKLFLSTVKNHRWYPIYVIACYCGLRQGEILGIHKRDINLEKGIIQVKYQVQAIRGEGLVITQVKTDKSNRPVTIPTSALTVLKEHLKSVNEDDDLIFTTSTGNPISPRNLVRHFKQVIKELNLPDIRFHDLRHTHASLLLSAGVHPKVVQERLGHSQISLTLDTYSHVIPSLQDEAADKFESLME